MTQLSEQQGLDRLLPRHFMYGPLSKHGAFTDDRALASTAVAFCVLATSLACLLCLPTGLFCTFGCCRVCCTCRLCRLLSQLILACMWEDCAVTNSLRQICCNMIRRDGIEHHVLAASKANHTRVEAVCPDQLGSYTITSPLGLLSIILLQWM